MMTPELHSRTIQELSTGGRLPLREKREVVQRASSMLRICPAIMALLGALASAAVLAAQEPPKKSTAQDSGFVLLQTVRRVRVDVVVTDGQGHPVKGLNIDDFHVLEDGKPQPLRQFEYHSEQNAAATFTARPPLPPHTFMNLPTVPEHGPLTVLLYDALNTPLEDQATARKDMLNFLKKNSGREIAIFVLGDSLRMVQGFTSDTEELQRQAGSADTALKQSSLMNVDSSMSKGLSSMAEQATTTVPAGAAGASGMADSMAAAFQRMADQAATAERELAAFKLDRRVDTTLDAMTQLARFLSGPEGRKNLIWFSASFPSEILPDATSTANAPINTSSSGGQAVSRSFDFERNYSERIKAVTNLLNSAQVAIYPVDARGLQTGSIFSAASRGSGSSTSVLKSNVDFARAQSAEHGSMDLLAEQTGGRAFYNTNGLERALETAADDGNSYYSIVYAPTNRKFDGSVRRIAVHLEHGHYHLAYRRSYFADDLSSETPKQIAENMESVSPDKAPVSGNLMAPDLQLGAPPSHQLVFAAHIDAIGAPEQATPEQMAALSPYREQAAKAKHIKIVLPPAPVAMQQYVIQYGLPASQLEFPKSANGAYHSDLSIATLAFNKDGETLWGTATRLKDDIPPAKYIDIRKNGYQAAQTFLIPADTAVIRLVVRDEQGGQNGSMEIRLPLPPEQQKGAGGH
jgi:VWFA-related protein